MSGRKLEFPLIIHCGRKQLLMLCCVVEWESGETSWSAPMSPVYSSVCTLLRRQLWSPLDTVTRHQLSQSLIWKIIKIFLCFYPDNFPDNWGLVEKLRSVASVSWLTGEKSCSLSLTDLLHHLCYDPNKEQDEHWAASLNTINIRSQSQQKLNQTKWHSMTNCVGLSQGCFVVALLCCVLIFLVTTLTTRELSVDLVEKVC